MKSPIIINLLLSFLNTLALGYTNENSLPNLYGQPRLSAISSLAMGAEHSLAVLQDGGVFSWGKNNFGELGDGTLIEKHNPIHVQSLEGGNFAGSIVAAGESFSVALRTWNGSVWTWGKNNLGQLGDGTFIERHNPVQVRKSSGGYLDNIIAIAAGECHGLALLADHTIWSWGCNTYGQLGDGTTTDRNTAVPVSTLTDILFIGAGNSHSLASKLSTDNRVFSWGLNLNGQLGDGTKTNRLIPVQVKNTNGSDFKATRLAGGGAFSLALQYDGGPVWAWGGNTYGQLGDGTLMERLNPVNVKKATTGQNFSADAIAAGKTHAIAYASNQGFSWGGNTAGQLGDGTNTNRNKAVSIQHGGGQPGPFQAILPIGTGSTALHSLTVRYDALPGQGAAFGSNTYGQLGDGTVVNRLLPVDIQ